MCNNYKDKIYPVSINTQDFYKDKNSNECFVFIRVDVGKVEQHQKRLNWINQEHIIKAMCEDFFYKAEHKECMRGGM